MNPAPTPNRLWPWLLALALAAVFVWLAVSAGDLWGPPDPATEATPSEVQPQLEPPGQQPATGAAAEEVVARTEQMRAAVRQYEDGCASRLEPAAGEGVGDLITECVERIAVALDAVVASDTVGQVVIDERLDRFRDQLERLQSTQPAARAVPTRDLLQSLTEVLSVIAEERYPETLSGEGSAQELRDAVGALDVGQPLEQQEEPVRRFFQAAAGLLSAMARPGDPGSD